MVELKEYNLANASEFAKYRTNPNIYINGFDSTPKPFTEKDAIDLIEKSLTKKPAERFAIYYEGHFCGDIGIWLKEDIYRNNVELGYWIAEPFWNKGIASKAIGLMTDYVFRHFNIVKIIATVFEYNKASMKALEKNGYTLEAVLKMETMKNGNYFDDYRYVKFNTNPK